MAEDTYVINSVTPQIVRVGISDNSFQRYYYNENSQHLAKKIENSLCDSLKTKKAEPLKASFAVIRPTESSGVLVEVAFMTNPIDSVLYTKEYFPAETAKAIADGILNYVNAE